MLIIRRHFEISANPTARDAIVSKLEELGCLLPTIKYHETKIFGNTVSQVYIKDSIDADKLDSLIEWLQTEITGVVSITY